MWVKTTADFIPQNISDEEFECYSEEDKKDVLEKRKFRFRTEEVAAYNESSEGLASIRMKSGYEVTINITLDELDRIMANTHK